MKPRKYIVILLSFIFYSAGGQLVIRGHVNTPATVMELKLFKYFFKRRNDLDAVSYFATLSKGVFSFRVPGINKPCYMSLRFAGEERALLPELYLVEPGDSIFISIQKDSVVFSGKGSAKMNLQYRVAAMPPITWDYRELVELKDSHGYRYLERGYEKYDSLYQKKAGLLDSYKKSISKVAVRRLKIDLRSEELYTVYSGFLFWLRRKEDSASRGEQARFYHEKLQYPDTRFAADLESGSKYFADFLMQKIFIEAVLKNPAAQGYSFEDIYSRIVREYTGELREKLVVSFFTQLYSSTGDQLQMLKKAVALCKNSYFISILKNIAASKNAGAPAPAFEMEKIDGSIVKLSGFRGKTVVIDFWFAGCTFCQELEKEMKKIRSRLVSDTTVVFLSINVDKSKEKWINAVKSGIYTDTENVNLYTNGLGTDHPLVKFYGFIGFPQIVIIDPAQRIVSANPERPVDESSVEKFVKLIQEQRTKGNKKL